MRRTPETTQPVDDEIEERTAPLRPNIVRPDVERSLHLPDLLNAPRPARRRTGPLRRLRSRDIAALLIALPLLPCVVAEILLFMRWHMLGADFYGTVRRMYFTGTIVMPCGLFGAGALGAWFWRWRRRSVLARTAWVLTAGAALIIAVRVYATTIEPHRLQVRTITIASPKIRAPIRIVHTSDIQSAAVGGYERRVFETIRELKPDLVLNTGDLLQPMAPKSYATEMPIMERLLRSLRPARGIYNVAGDTDDAMMTAFAQGFGGMVTLDDRGESIACRGTRLRLFGMGLNASAGHGAKDLIAGWLSTVQDEEFTILIGHRPDYILQLPERPVDLCLAGHTHGGQVRLPGWGPLVTESSVPRELAWGYHELGNARLNVSAGVGCEHISGVPPLRVNCPPELVVIDLVPRTE